MGYIMKDGIKYGGIQNQDPAEDQLLALGMRIIKLQYSDITIPSSGSVVIDTISNIATIPSDRDDIKTSDHLISMYIYRFHGNNGALSLCADENGNIHLMGAAQTVSIDVAYCFVRNVVFDTYTIVEEAGEEIIIGG